MPSFRLTSILWAVALLLAALVVFDSWGILYAFVITIYWGRVYYDAPSFWVGVILSLLVVAVLVGLHLPAIQASREYGRESQCVSRMREIASALDVYSKRKHTLPAAHARIGNNGHPCSWRVHLLRQLDRPLLFDSYNRDKAWNSADNLKVIRAPIEVFTCPSDSRQSGVDALTNYFAIVGPHAAFLADADRKWSDFTDGRAQTIMLIESAGRNTPWGIPEDLSIDDAVTLLTNPTAASITHTRVERV